MSQKPPSVTPPRAASVPAQRPIAPSDLAAAGQKLTVSREDGFADLAWLDAGFEDPAAFWRALMQLWAGSGPPPKSRLLERYDLYHDMIARHLSPARAAFTWYDRVARQVRSISYAELHARSARMAGAWAAQKVKAGDVLAVVLPVGCDWLVAVLAGLRLGVVLSFLPPLGALYLGNRLAALKPDHIATDPLYLTLLQGQEKRILGDGPVTAGPFDRSHTFPSGEPCALVFSPLREPAGKPVPLAIDSAFLLALRDGVITFSLRPGDVMAAPGLEPTQHQPSLVFSTLLAGGTFFHLTLADLAVDPHLLLQFPLRAAGLSNAVRDLLLAAPLGAITTWSHWWKNPEEPFDAGAWTTFGEAHGLKDVPSSNVVIDAASGGATLFSVRRPGGRSSRVLPAAGGPWVALPPVGRPWALYDVVQTGELATGETGLYAPAPTKKPAELGHMLISGGSGGEYLYGGTIAPRRSGRVYPTAEVLAAIADLPFNEGAAVISVPSGGVASSALFVLIVFTGAEDLATVTAEAAARTAAIERAVQSKLGGGLSPDRTMFFPLYPRTKDGAVDQGWCEAQLHRGSLFRKSREPAFQRLTAVRKRFVKDAGAG